jgi:hypothetical protein
MGTIFIGDMGKGECVNVFLSLEELRASKMFEMN